MAITLHSWPRSSGTRVAWALEELGVAYEYVQLGLTIDAHPRVTGWLRRCSERPACRRAR